MTGEYVPAAQLRQKTSEVAPAEKEYVPGAQGVQEAVPVALYVPNAQEEQKDAPVEGEYVPAAQSVQSDAPSRLKVPAGQLEHSALPPELNVPAAQGRQEAGALAYVPAGHVDTEKPHDGAPATLYAPAAQVVQADAPLSLNFPAAHAEHAEAPTRLYEPGGQKLQK